MFGGSDRKIAYLIMAMATVIKNSPTQGAQRELPWQVLFISSYCFMAVRAFDLLALKTKSVKWGYESVK